MGIYFIYNISKKENIAIKGDTIWSFQQWNIVKLPQILITTIHCKLEIFAGSCFAYSQVAFGIHLIIFH